jgi:hypothetical protein
MAGASTVCFTGLSSSYKYYFLTWEAVSGSSSSCMFLRASTDNGSTYISSSLYGGTSSSTNGTYALLTACRMYIGSVEYHPCGVASAGHHAHGYSFLHGLGSSTTLFGVLGRSSWVGYPGCQYNIRVNPLLVTGAANISSINGIRLYVASGTFYSGKMSLYGVS